MYLLDDLGLERFKERELDLSPLAEPLSFVDRALCNRDR